LERGIINPGNWLGTSHGIYLPTYGQTLNLINTGQVDEYLDTEPELGDICKIAKALDIEKVEKLSPFSLMRKITAAMTQRKDAVRDEQRQEAVREEQRKEVVRHEKDREKHLEVDRLKKTAEHLEVGRFRKLPHGHLHATPDITLMEPKLAEEKGAKASSKEVALRFDDVHGPSSRYAQFLFERST